MLSNVIHDESAALLEEAAGLEALASGFASVGNPGVAFRLSHAASSIRCSARRLVDAYGAHVDEDVSNAEQAALNMLAVALRTT